MITLVKPVNILAQSKEYGEMMIFSFANFNSRRKFGVELEVNERITPAILAKVVKEADGQREVVVHTVYRRDANNNFWIVKFDRSCSDVERVGGWEIASYVGRGYKDIKVIRKVTDAIKQCGALVNNNCGLHIHASVEDFTRDQISVLVAYWLKVEEIILGMVPRHRRDSVHCVPLTKKYRFSTKKTYNLRDFWAVASPRGETDRYRKVSLNLCNYVFDPDKKTIEFRLPEGTLEGTEVENWIRFYLNFFDFVKKRNMPENLSSLGVRESFEILGLHGELPFLVLSKGLNLTKIWALKRLMKNSDNKNHIDEAKVMLGTLEMPNTILPQMDLTEPFSKEKISGSLWKKA